MQENKQGLNAEVEKYLNFCKLNGIDPNNADNLRGFIYNNMASFYLKLHIKQLKELQAKTKQYITTFVCYDTITHEKCENDTIAQIIKNLNEVDEVLNKNLKQAINNLSKTKLSEVLQNVNKQ